MYAVIDIETTGLDRYKDRIVALGMFIPEKDYYGIFTCEKDFKDCLDTFKANGIELLYVYQNGKFDTLFLEVNWHVELPIHEDVMLLSYVYDMGGRKSLKYLAEKYFGTPDWDISTAEKGEFTEKMVHYLKLDLYWTWRLFEYLYSCLTPAMKKVYDYLVVPSYNAYRIVERNGVYIDMTRLRELIKEYTVKRDNLANELKKIKDINWNSSSQVAKLLINDFMLPILKVTPKGSPSVDSSVLKKYSSMGYDVVDKLLEFKYYEKALGTFLLRWEKDQVDGRLHPTFNIDTTRTGRTSCENPNLQQVPRDINLRSLFTARPGYQFIEADQSQVELRIAAEYAHEKNMIDIYKNDGDIHTETAKATTRKEEVSKDDRRRAKAVNFGFLYGMTAKKFVEYAKDSYGVDFTQAEAEEYRDRFFARYPGLNLWYKQQKAECVAEGGCYTKFGRFRKLPEIYSKDFMDKSSAERKCINTPVQSTASDILLCGLIEIVNTCPEVIVCGTVHDAILMEVPNERAEELRLRVKHIMENPQLLKVFDIELKIPLCVDAPLGAWGTH